MTRMRQYLPYAEWPEEDRGLWVSAFKKGEGLFDDCGSGAHLSERSQQQLQYAYGKFLKFVSVRYPDRLGCDPAVRVKPDTIEQFVKFQPKTCGDVTISIYLIPPLARPEVDVPCRRLVLAGDDQRAHCRAGKTEAQEISSGDERDALRAGDRPHG